MSLNISSTPIYDNYIDIQVQAVAIHMEYVRITSLLR